MGTLKRSMSSRNAKLRWIHHAGMDNDFKNWQCVLRCTFNLPAYLLSIDISPHAQSGSVSLMFELLDASWRARTSQLSHKKVSWSSYRSCRQSSLTMCRCERTQIGAHLQDGLLDPRPPLQIQPPDPDLSCSADKSHNVTFLEQL